MNKIQKMLSTVVVLGSLGSPVLATGAFAATSNQMISIVETKANFIYDFLGLLGQTPDKTGKSPFSDVNTGSWQWGWIHKALDLNLVSPDSATFFGAKDRVSQAFAANMAIQFLKVNLPSGVTPLQFAEQNQLFAGMNPGQDMTLANTLGFLSKVQKYAANNMQSIPASWNMSKSAGQALSQALINSVSAPFEQLNMKMNMSIGFKLTAAGQKDSALAKMVGAISHPINMTMQMNEQRTNGQISFLNTITTTVPTTTSSATPQQLKIQEFLQNGKLYMNQGQGWQLFPLPGSVQSLLSSQLGGINLTTSILSGMTATQTASGYSYSGTLNAAGLGNEMSYLFRNLPAASLLSSGQSSAQMQSFMKALMQSMNGTVSLQVSKVNGMYALSGEKLQINLEITPQEIAGLAASAAASSSSSSAVTSSLTKFISEVQAITISEQVTAQIGYQMVPVTAPTGLPK